jgi:hypothetical protein
VSSGYKSDADMKKKSRVVWNGVLYPSVSAAAKTEGISTQAMYIRIKKAARQTAAQGTMTDDECDGFYKTLYRIFQLTIIKEEGDKDIYDSMHKVMRLSQELLCRFSKDFAESSAYNEKPRKDREIAEHKEIVRAIAQRKAGGSE